MKINKSKVELAAKIKSSGLEWSQFGKWATQDKDGEVFMSGGDFTPVRMSGEVNWEFDAPYKSAGKFEVGINWFQCILSSAEYFSLYPVAETAPELEPEPDAEVKLAELVAACEALGAVLSAAGIETVVEAKPTIEQLAADYRNAKDYAERKQQEADDAKADAEAKLKVLELAGEALGLLVSPITEKQETELAAAVKVGDEVECVKSNIKRDKYNGMVGRLHTIDESDTSTPYLVDFGGNAKIWCHEVKFIRLP